MTSHFPQGPPAVPGGYSPYQQVGQAGPAAQVGNGPQYASFGARFAANVVDAALMFVLLIMVFIASDPLTGEETCAARELGPDECIITDGAALWMLVFWGAWLLVTMVYFAWMWQGSGQTLGMRVARIKMVSDLDPNQTISTGRAVLRVTVRTGLNLMCIGWLGSLWMLWDSQSRTWQDMAAGSRVIKLVAVPVQYMAVPAQAPVGPRPVSAPQYRAPQTPVHQPPPPLPPPAPAPIPQPTAQRSARTDQPGWPTTDA